MKYMTFLASCSYAGLANMLEQYGLDTTDRSIALAMKLPYLFDCCDGVYVSGPMLQTAEWFDLYLNPLGYRFIEKMLPSAALADYLKSQKTAMLGILMENAQKHAVIYIGKRNHQLVFLNNKHQTDDAPDAFFFTEEQLLQRTEATTPVATLESISPKRVSFTEKLENSILILQKNLSAILTLCLTETTVENLRSQLNTLFRPLLLDGITMLHLVGETQLAEEFSAIQKALLNALRREDGQIIRLQDSLPTERLRAAVERYQALIRQEITSAQVP